VRFANQLGLSIPSVGTYIARAMKKLGVDSRVRLITLLSVMQRQCEES
jgi:DNA-binding CsgD family transcriptional regulator